MTTTEVWLEQLIGSVDGSNVDFRTRFVPIADANADGDVDDDDVTIYYATFDSTTGWIELGSAVNSSSVQAETGIITMTTAPTSTTAEAGVWAIYRYDTHGKTDYDILALAASYYLGYIVANKIAGETPKLHLIEDAPYIRKETTGADWLKLCYEALGLQDKVFLVRSDGFGVPPMQPRATSKIKRLD